MIWTLFTVTGHGRPELYDSSDPIKFRVEIEVEFEYLPLNPVTNQAFLGDPRNDENTIIARDARSLSVVS